ncbi:MAG: Ig-like domain-containing protein [Deltaproteobacteria bacterium]|nr:Ig-like domain-containing protein [Deltaproteobacteria bacterium]
MRRLPRNRSLASIWLALALAQVLGCGACHQVTSTSVNTIGKDGGKLHSDDCGFTLTIPAGALPQDVPFVLQTVASPNLPSITGRVRVSKDCGVQPIVPFAKPATVTLDYDPTQVPKQVSEGDVDVRVAPSSAKEVRLQNLSVDTNAHVATATTTATGDFFATAPQGPQPAEIDLTPASAVALKPGQTQQFTAVVKDDTGEPDPTPVTWAVDLQRVATIDSNGLLTAVAPGVAVVTAAAGTVTASVQVYVISQVPSPSQFDWENPRPQGNDIHGLGFIDGQLLVAANNGTVVAQLGDGGFARLSSGRSLALAGAASGGGRLGAAGTLDVVQQSVELIQGVLVSLEGDAAEVQEVDPSSLSARAVYGDDAGVIAVGSGNDCYLLRNGDLPDAGWVGVETPVSEALIAVDADPVGGRRVVGARGQVYRLNETDWFPIWDTPLETLLAQATMVGHDAYAVDGANGLHHFVEGQGWQPDDTPPGVALDNVGLLGRLGTTVALAGQDTTLLPHLWLRDGATWTEAPGIDIHDQLYAAASDGTTSWVAGTNGALYTVDDGGVTSVRTGSVDDISAIAVGPDGSAFAVTSDGCGDALCTSQHPELLVRGSDGTWTVAANLPPSDPLRAVAVRSSGDVFLAGDNGVAWHFNGNSFDLLNTPTTLNIHALKVCGGDVWMVGDQGLIAKFDGASNFVAEGSVGANLWAIACPSDHDIWVAGDYALLNFDGQNWNQSASTVNMQPWRALYVSDEEIWVAGETDYLLHGDRVGNTWDAVQDPAGLRMHGGYGLWASGPGDLYLVGTQQRPRQGLLLRNDGAEWYALDPGTDHELYAIDGAGAGDFFIAGNGGAILHSHD